MLSVVHNCRLANTSARRSPRHGTCSRSKPPCDPTQVSVLAFARLMVGQGLQHPAGLPIGLTVAGLHDAHQFSLQPPQPRDPITDFDNPILRDAVRVAMGSMGCLLQRDQFGNGVEVETELPGMGD